ncbi:MAG: sigma-70 family RNA polymerase sigma factor [Bacteroidota bacterium]|nr:sigma-70 family RNA polymerase sigma factor [Bacteroidota bacterium]
MKTGKHNKYQTTDLGIRLMSSRTKFLGYIRKRISDPELAEDILQDSLLKAVRSAPEIRGEENLVRWFYRVLQNAITDAYRRKAAELKRRMSYALEIKDSIEPEDENAVCLCINELILALKPEYAEVVQLIDLNGEAPGAVAARLGISRNNLKVRAHRARQMLRKRLEETCRVCAVHHCLDCTCGQSHASLQH